jgi:hypothetical protein
MTMPLGGAIVIVFTDLLLARLVWTLSMLRAYCNSLLENYMAGVLLSCYRWLSYSVPFKDPGRKERMTSKASSEPWLPLHPLSLVNGFCFFVCLYLP